MASGDTKTEALLNVLGNGGDASQYKGCCNTKTQSYILDAIDRIQNVEDEVEELKNNPDVVDIVDTYADLQAYDTQHLTENDIIRVLQDETHSGNSTYYRFTKNPDTWTFIGEISGGGGGDETYTDLSTLTPDFPTNNPDGIASWNLPVGNYYVSSGNGVRFYYSNQSYALLDEQYRVNIGPVINGVYCSTIESIGYSGDIHEYYCYKNAPGHQDGQYITDHFFLTNREVIDNFISYASQNPLSASRGRVLYNMITPTTGASAPTTSTQGELGKIFIDTTNDDAYMCVKASGGTYTWKKITS